MSSDNPNITRRATAAFRPQQNNNEADNLAQSILNDKQPDMVFMDQDEAPIK